MSISGLSLGDASNIPKEYTKVVLESFKQDNIDVMKKSFNEFGLIFDGTPSFAEAEAVKVRVVTHNWEIAEPLVRVGIFKHKLNAENIANNLLFTIKKQLKKNEKHWLTSQQDRASTNQSALKKIRNTTLHANPVRNDCCSHTLHNSGGEMTKNNRAKFCEDFRKKYQSVIKYSEYL